MFAVIFEVAPLPDLWDSYLGNAKLLRPELERIDGFVDNVRYKSLTRDGWLLSLSSWRDEKAVVRWRTHAGHHAVQAKGRAEILRDYHLRVGEVTRDTHLPTGMHIVAQRLDETAVGQGAAVTLTTATGPAGLKADEAARLLGLRAEAPGLVAWDVFEAVLTPGDFILMTTWRDSVAADYAHPAQARRRDVRIVRDYGMFDRREAPQYFPPAAAKT